MCHYWSQSRLQYRRNNHSRCSPGSTLKKKNAKLPINGDHTTTRSEVWLMRKPQDWGQPCPNPSCSHYRLVNRGNMSAISTYLTQSGKRRIFRCGACETPCSETRDTVFFDLRTPEEKVIMALKMLLVKVALSDMGFVMGVTEATVLEWLRRAAEKAHEINAHLLRARPVPREQLEGM